MSMSTAGSVTIIIRAIRSGDQSAATPLWARYFERLARHANKFLCWNTRLIDMDEDVALLALNDFCNGLSAGKFEDVDSREQLWRLLAKIIERKAYRLINERRWKRERLFTDLEPTGSQAGDSRTPVVVFEPVDRYKEIVGIELNELIDSLPNPLWREAVRMTLEGDTVREIAEKLQYSSSYVHVWLRTIRALWEEQYGRDNFFG